MKLTPNLKTSTSVGCITLPGFITSISMACYTVFLLLGTPSPLQAGMINTAVSLSNPFQIFEGDGWHDMYLTWKNANSYPIIMLSIEGNPATTNSFTQVFAEADDVNRIIVLPIITVVGNYETNELGLLVIPAGGYLVDKVSFAAVDDGADDSFSLPWRIAEEAILVNTLLYSDNGTGQHADSVAFTIDLIEVPEPSSLVLVGLGAAALIICRAASGRVKLPTIRKQ